MRCRIRKIADYFTAASFVIVVAFAAAWFGKLGESDHGGPFQVIDGDSLVSGDKRFRLEGIDAPEYRQTCRKKGGEWPCGKQAAGYLRSMINQPGAFCKGLGIDKYDRILARCSLGKQDINGLMVENGWAVSFGDYQGEERRARDARSGMWEGDFIRPQEWRNLNAAAAEAPRTGIFYTLLAKLRLWWQSF